MSFPRTFYSSSRRVSFLPCPLQYHTFEGHSRSFPKGHWKMGHWMCQAKPTVGEAIQGTAGGAYGRDIQRAAQKSAQLEAIGESYHGIRQQLYNGIQPPRLPALPLPQLIQALNDTTYNSRFCHSVFTFSCYTLPESPGSCIIYGLTYGAIRSHLRCIRF